MEDYNDMCIRWEGHPKFDSDKIIEDEAIEVLVQKLEMILYTNKGDVFGDNNIGCNLTYFLWTTNVSTDDMKDIIDEQIELYIPELKSIGYSLNLELFEGEIRDIMFINFVINGQYVEFVFE